METWKIWMFVKFCVLYTASGYLNLDDHDLMCLYKECLVLTEYLGDIATQMTIYLMLTVVTCKVSYFNETIAYGNKAAFEVLDVPIPKGTWEAIAVIYDRMGTAYMSLCKYHDAIEHYEKILHIAIDIGHKKGEGAANVSLGIVYQLLGKYQKTIDCSKKSLQIAIDIGDKDGEGTAYSSLGTVNQSLGKYHKAIWFYKKSLHIAIDIGDKDGEGTAYANLGIANNSLGNYLEAIDYYEKSLKLAIDIPGNRHKAGSVNVNLGNVYKRLGKYDEAIKCYKKSLDIAIGMSDKQGEGTCLHNLGSLFYTLSRLCDKVSLDAEYKQFLKESIVCLKGAMQCREWLFDHLKDSDDFKISIVDTYIVTYKFLSMVLIENQQTEEALLAAERGRARALADIWISKYNMAQDVALQCDPLKYDDVSYLSTYSFDILYFVIMPLYLGIWAVTSQKTHFIKITTPGNEVFEDFVNDVVIAAFDELGVGKLSRNCENRSLDFIENSHVEEQTTNVTETFCLGEFSRTTKKKKIAKIISK